jgi:hypothetical protein
MNRLIVGGVAAILLVAAGCGGDNGANGTTTPTGSVAGIATLSGLQAQLASVLLQQADVPPGLDASAPSFSTNQDVAGSNVQALQTMLDQGRQLGVDSQFIPTDRLDPNSPLKGGIQSSASVYIDTLGASRSFQDTAAQARANNWQANYPDLLDLTVTEVPRSFGDDSLWLRIEGKEQCQSLESPSPGVAPPASCSGQQLVVLDNVILRAGRTRAFLQVVTLFPLGSPPEVFEDQTQQWAQTVAQRAQTAFPTS